MNSEQQMPTREKILSAIKEGVADAMPDPEDICEAVRSSIRAAMPFPSLILGAIADGAKEATEAHLKTRKAKGF